MMRLKQYSKNTVKNLLIYSLCFLFLFGCVREEIEEVKGNPIESKLTKIFKEDYGLDITVKLIGKTLWVYIPVEHIMLILDKMQTLFVEDKPLKFNVRFITGNYKSQTFDFNFYIEQNPELPKAKELFEGVTYNLTQETAEININTYNYLQEIAWGYPEKIDFFVLTIADIKRGIEFVQTINALDLKKSSINAIPGDEFSKRKLTSIRGHQEIVNNKKGSYLEYKDVDFVDFIIDQTISRVKMDLPTQQDITSATDINKIILRTLWEAAKNYEFNDFFMVKISNMVSQDEISYSRLAMQERFEKPAAEDLK